MDREELLLEQWKTASELQRHDDQINWQKFNYYLILNGLLVTVLGVILRDGGSPATARIDVMSGLVALFGFIVSAVWTLVQGRGQLYQNYRIAQAREAESALAMSGERVLTIYGRGLNEQELVHVPRLLRLPIRYLVLFLATFITLVWAVVALVFLLLT